MGGPGRVTAVDAPAGGDIEPSATTRSEMLTALISPSRFMARLLSSSRRFNLPSHLSGDLTNVHADGCRGGVQHGTEPVERCLSHSGAFLVAE